jgi:hypothetical protein
MLRVELVDLVDRSQLRLTPMEGPAVMVLPEKLASFSSGRWRDDLS